MAILLGTVATPAGVILAWLAPRPLDLAVAWPLVVLDLWAARPAISGSAYAQLLLLALGIALTWLFYVVVARVVLWRLALRMPE